MDMLTMRSDVRVRIRTLVLVLGMALAIGLGTATQAWAASDLAGLQNAITSSQESYGDGPISVNDGKSHVLNVANSIKLDTGTYISVTNGSDLTIMGNGTLTGAGPAGEGIPPVPIWAESGTVTIDMEGGGIDGNGLNAVIMGYEVGGTGPSDATGQGTLSIKSGTLKSSSQNSPGDDGFGEPTVAFYGKTFEMSGGTIESPGASAKANTLWLEGNGTTTISGGSITSTASCDRPAVVVNGPSLTFTGEAYIDSGQDKAILFDSPSGTLTVSGGTITSNTSLNNAVPTVDVQRGSLDMSNGTVENTGDGAAIGFHNATGGDIEYNGTGTCVISGGIVNNDSDANAATIAVGDGKLTISGGTVENGGGDAENGEGGPAVLISNAGICEISGGTVKSNDGYQTISFNGATLDITGGVISCDDGIAILSEAGKTTISGGKVGGHVASKTKTSSVPAEKSPIVDIVGGIVTGTVTTQLGGTVTVGNSEGAGPTINGPVSGNATTVYGGSFAGTTTFANGVTFGRPFGDIYAAPSDETLIMSSMAPKGPEEASKVEATTEGEGQQTYYGTTLPDLSNVANLTGVTVTSTASAGSSGSSGLAVPPKTPVVNESKSPVDVSYTNNGGETTGTGTIPAGSNNETIPLPVLESKSVYASRDNRTATVGVMNANAYGTGDISVTVYGGDGSAITGRVTGTYENGAITLTFNPPITSAQTYRIALTPAAGFESEQIALTVNPYPSGSGSSGGTSKPSPQKQLQAAVSDAVAKYGSTNDGGWTSASFAPYAKALADAQALLNDAEATDAQLTAANTALADAIKGLVPLTAESAKAEADKAIAAAGALTESEYTAESWASLQEALNALNALLDDGAATPQQVDAATQAVNDAIAALVPAQPAEDTVDVYRVLNPDTQEHLYTKDLNEYNALTTKYGWEGENVAWTAPTSSSTPIYRLRHPGGGHLYTTSLNEYNYLDQHEAWVGEGIALYSAPATDSVPIYRLYNPTYFIGFAHLWTADFNEYTYQGSHGWDQEDVAFYAITAPGMQ